MTTTYPASVDSLSNPSTSDTLATASHHTQHGDANDAIEEIETKLGIGASTPVLGDMLVGTDTGESAWRQQAWVDIRDYGAVAGGNAAANAAAIAAAIAVGTGHIRIPEGVFDIDSTLTIAGTDDPVIIEGVGQGVSASGSTIRWTGGASVVFDVTGADGGILFRDFKIDNSGTATIGIRVGQIPDFTTDHLMIFPTNAFSVAGIQLGTGAVSPHAISIQNTYIRNCANGLLVWGVGSHLDVINSRFVFNGYGATSVNLQTSAAADDIIDATAHGFIVGQKVRFPTLTGGTGLTAGTNYYYVIAANFGANTFQVSATDGGAAVNFTTDITAGTVAWVGNDVVLGSASLAAQSVSFFGCTFDQTTNSLITGVLVRRAETVNFYGCYFEYHGTPISPAYAIDIPSSTVLAWGINVDGCFFSSVVGSAGYVIRTNFASTHLSLINNMFLQAWPNPAYIVQNLNSAAIALINNQLRTTGMETIDDFTVGKVLALGNWITTGVTPTRLPGAVITSGIISPTQLAANTNDWAPTSVLSCAVIRASTDASRNLTGLASGNNVGGRQIVLMNVGAQNLVLVHDATSTAANRFLCPGSANFTLNANDSVMLMYDATSARWRVLAA